MKKKLKKIVSTLLCLVFVLSLSGTAFAEAPVEDALNSLADELISVTEYQETDGSVSTTYTHLDDFVAAAYERYPDINDETLAEFIATYTGHDAEAMGPDGLLSLLDYDNITTKIVNNLQGNGSRSVSASELEDKLTLAVSYSFTGLDGTSNNKFDVWAIATWTDYPTIRIQDALAIGTDGAYFDNSADYYGYRRQTFYCPDCGETTTFNNSVSDAYGNDEDGSLELKSSNGRPYIRFGLSYPGCDNMNCTAQRAVDRHLSAYLKYGVIVNGLNSVAEAYANYGHLAAGNISNMLTVSYSGNGSFSFNATGNSPIVETFADSYSVTIRPPEY